MILTLPEKLLRTKIDEEREREGTNKKEKR